MKNTILSVAMITLVVVSCKENKASSEVENIEKSEIAASMTKVDSSEISDASSTNMQSRIETSQNEIAELNTKFSTDEIVSNYLVLKNALVEDDGKATASAGKTLYNTFTNIDANSIDSKLKKEFLDIIEDAKENAEHIGDNEDKIDHQREHFILLSKDMNDLITMFGSKKKLYQDFCPMANNGKGAIWISEMKDIKNPYQGSKMQTCGSLKKEL